MDDSIDGLFGLFDNPDYFFHDQVLSVGRQSTQKGV